MKICCETEMVYGEDYFNDADFEQWTCLKCGKTIRHVRETLEVDDIRTFIEHYGSSEQLKAFKEYWSDE